MKSGVGIASLLLIVALGAGGYFALRSMTDPASYLGQTTEKIGDLQRLETEPAGVGGRAGAPQDTATASGDSSSGAPANQTPSTTATDPDQDLINHLNDLITAKTTLKVGSKGVSVGYVQSFMNRYFDKTSKIDNDFGKILESNVRTFQTQNKITATGQVASQTLGKMVEWLKNH